MPQSITFCPHKELTKDLLPDPHVDPPTPMSVDSLPMTKDGQRAPAAALPESVENRSQNDQDIHRRSTATLV